MAKDALTEQERFPDTTKTYGETVTKRHGLNCLESNAINRTESDTVKGAEIDPFKNGWISVKERLPEPFISVLGHCPDEEPLPTVHECYMNGFGQWMSAQVYGMGNVTHWMPLPEGPDKKLVKNEEQIGGRQC